MSNPWNHREWLCWIGVVILFVAISDIAKGIEDSEYMLERSTFESWVFQQEGSLAEGLRRLESELDRIMRGVKAVVELSAVEEQELLLAAKGDIKRFVDTVYQAYIPLSVKNLTDDSFDDAWEKTLPLQKRLNKGLFEEGSLFQKVLMRVLSKDEKTAWLAARKEQSNREKAILVDAFIADLERVVPLLKIQRDKLRELLFEKTPAIRNVDENGVFVIQYYFARIDEPTCKELFDPEQMKFLEVVRREGQEMGHLLDEEGIAVEEIKQ